MSDSNLGASVPSVPVRESPWAQCPGRPSGNFGVRSPEGLLPLCGSKIHLRFPVACEFYIRLCIATRTSGAARRVTTFERKNRRGARRPVRLQSISARGRSFAAYLSACGGQLLIVRCAHYAEGASLTTFGFVTTVPRYLLKASNSLTFVRGADRACCAPRKWRHCLIYVPRKWSGRPTFALYVPVAVRPRRV